MTQAHTFKEIDPERQRILDYIETWHGDHTAEYLIEEMDYEPDNAECEVYMALQEYKRGDTDMPWEKLLAVMKEVDGEGYRNMLDVYDPNQS